MKGIIRVAIWGLMITLLVWGCERKTTNEITEVVTPSSAEYVGSNACEACHSDIHASFVRTGHPFKLNDAADAQLPSYYPFSSVEPPPSLTWSQIEMVIGGFWWKARYINADGFVYTGPDKQYNMRLHPDDPAPPEFVKYTTSFDSTRTYACGPCHMTNYQDVGNQDGKPGLIGTWAANGIQCEECHGPGEHHVVDPRAVEMTIDRSNEACGKCHIRGDVGKIPASGGFVRHHEQWNEMFRTKHSTLQCVSCHDPHYGLHPLNPDRDMAIRIQCEDCHYKVPVALAASPYEHTDGGVTCIDCHMPRAAKSAAAVTANIGDVRSHMWRINPDSTAAFITGGFANGYLTTQFSCLPCHPSMTAGDFALAAEDIHPIEH